MSIFVANCRGCPGIPGIAWFVREYGNSVLVPYRLLGQGRGGRTERGQQQEGGRGEVAVRSVGGKIDQGGGVVGRYVDADHSYVCRYNPLEENFRVYYVKGGKRTQPATKENVELPAGKWLTVSVTHAGDKIKCA